MWGPLISWGRAGLDSAYTNGYLFPLHALILCVLADNHPLECSICYRQQYIFLASHPTTHSTTSLDMSRVVASVSSLLDSLS